MHKLFLIKNFAFKIDLNGLLWKKRLNLKKDLTFITQLLNNPDITFTNIENLLRIIHSFCGNSNFGCLTTK